MSKKLSLTLLLLVTALFSSFLIGVFVGRNIGRSDVKLSQYDKTEQNTAITETTDVSETTIVTMSVTVTETAATTETTSEAETEPITVPEATVANETRGKININTATAEDLMLLPGIGEVLAQRILDYRKENGRYSSIGELINVRGIGEKTLNKISDYITVGG